MIERDERATAPSSGSGSGSRNKSSILGTSSDRRGRRREKPSTLNRSNEMIEKKFIGYLSVKSGQLMMVDPEIIRSNISEDCSKCNCNCKEAKSPGHCPCRTAEMEQELFEMARIFPFGGCIKGEGGQKAGIVVSLPDDMKKIQVHIVYDDGRPVMLALDLDRPRR